MVVSDAYVLPGFLTPVQTQLFFPKPPNTFLTCFCREERRKYTEKKSRLNWGTNSQPPGHEPDTLTTEPPGWGVLNQTQISRTYRLLQHPSSDRHLQSVYILYDIPITSLKLSTDNISKKIS